MTQLEVTITDEKGRLDKVLTEKLTDYSRSQIQQWLKEEAVTLEGTPVKANYKVKNGNHFVITIPEAVTLDLIAEDIPLDIVYQDEDVAVINKPDVSLSIR